MFDRVLNTPTSPVDSASYFQMLWLLFLKMSYKLVLLQISNKILEITSRKTYRERNKEGYIFQERIKTAKGAKGVAFIDITCPTGKPG